MVRYTKKYCNRSNASCEFTPTSYIKAKINIIFWSNTNKKKLQQCQYYSWFAILHQHPTVKPNSIFYLVQYKYKSLQQCQRDSQFYINILHESISIYFYNNILHWIKIQYILWSKTNQKICISANVICVFRFYINILHWIKFNILFVPIEIS